MRALALSSTRVLWQEQALTAEGHTVVHLFAKERHYHNGAIVETLLEHRFWLDFPEIRCFYEKIYLQSREIAFCYDCRKSNPFVLQVRFLCEHSTTLKIRFQLKNNVLYNTLS